MATAELAASLPVLLLVLGVAISAVSVVSARIRAQDAAREAVRVVARGDSESARRLVARLAPGATLEIGQAGDVVTARVRLTVHPVGTFLPALHVSVRAAAAREPGPAAAASADRGPAP